MMLRQPRIETVHLDSAESKTYPAHVCFLQNQHRFRWGSFFNRKPSPQTREVLEHHLIMELAEGGSLAAVVKSRPGPTVKQMVATHPGFLCLPCAPITLYNRSNKG